MKGREGFRFLSPSRRACSAGYNAFKKMKCIFSITSVENLEKSLKNTHRTLAQRPVYSLFFMRVESVCRTVQRVSIGRGLNTVPMSDGV